MSYPIVNGTGKALDARTGEVLARDARAPISQLPALAGGITEAQYERYRMLQALMTRVEQLHAGSTDPRLADVHGAGAHPIRTLTDRMHPTTRKHEVKMLVWHLMRQYLPILDATIGKHRRALEGDVVITSDDEGLQEALTGFWTDVPAGYLGGRASYRGGDTYLNMLAENADEYGVGVGEIQPDEQGTEIRRLVAPNMRTVSMEDRDNDDVWELYQTQGGSRKRIDDSPLVQVMAFRPATENPWPPPLAWSLEKTAEAILRMMEALINGWWRFGDPSMLVGINYDPEANPQLTSEETEEGQDGGPIEIPEALLALIQAWNHVMQQRRAGKVGDVFAWAPGGELTQEVIGQVDATLMKFFTDHQSRLNAEVVAHAECPIWMFPQLEQSGDGLGSERSTNMGLVAATAAEKRNRLKERLAREILDTHLVLQGDGRFVGRYEIAFDRISLIDEQAEAEAALTQAEADAQTIENVEMLFSPEGERRWPEGSEADEYLQEREVLR